MITLKKDGFWREHSKKNRETGEYEEVREKIDTTGKESLELIRCWEESMEIEEGVTCNDFFKVLADMDEGLLTMVELLTNSNIKPHVRKAFNPLPPDYVDDSELTAVEIYKVMEINNHGLDEILEPYLDDDYACAHGIGKPWTHGFENDPMTDEEKIAKGCNTYAIEFTPWNQLAHLPLVFKKKIWFSEVVWRKSGKKRKLISNGPDEGWNVSDMEIDREKGFQREVLWNPRVREFFNGFTNELCFFGSPDDQEEQSAILKGRMEDVEKMIEDEKKNKN
jgi:hypothetical protein